MPEYLSPGVYVEEIDTGAVPIAGVGTSTAGFLGRTERGPTDPELVTSPAEFSRTFGGFDLYKEGKRLEGTYLAYAVDGFFRNGGARCYVGRITAETDAARTTLSADTDGTVSDGESNGDALEIEAVGPGDWGGHVAVIVEPATIRIQKSKRFRLTVLYWTELKEGATSDGPDGGDDADGNGGDNDTSDDGDVGNRKSPREKLIAVHDDPDVEEVYDNLSPKRASSDYYENAINGTSTLIEVTRVAGGSPAFGTTWLGVANHDEPGPGSEPKPKPKPDPDPDPDPDPVPESFDVEEFLDGTVGEIEGKLETGEYDQYLDEIREAEENGQDRAGVQDAIDSRPQTDGGVDDRSPRTDGGGEKNGGVGLGDYRGCDSPGKRTGLAAFREVDEINIVCAPDESSIDGLTAEIVNHCETVGDRFALLQAKRGTRPEDLPEHLPVSDRGYAAFYTPWITVIDPVTDLKKFVPPGGHVAGIYARSDTERGVHKAPANEQVRGAQELEFNITKGEQDILNPTGINCIRSFRGRGIRVWGARTTSPNALWKYVNVRRLFLYLEESIDEGTQWVVFEPNDEKLWARARQSVGSFLTTVWRNGALMGTTPAEAFYVKCDRTTMTQDDIDNGRLIVEIGVSPVKPAEFVVFRITQWTGSEQGL